MRQLTEGFRLTPQSRPLELPPPYNAKTEFHEIRHQDFCV